MTVRIATAEEIDACIALRHEVFVVEQGVPLALEVDGLDPDCAHVIALDDRGAVVGTARVRVIDSAYAKAERVAIARRARGTGLGAAVMRALHEHVRGQGIHTVKLGAQTDVIAFYERLGYVAHGPVFDDAGIPHRAMTLDLTAAR